MYNMYFVVTLQTPLIHYSSFELTFVSICLQTYLFTACLELVIWSTLENPRQTNLMQKMHIFILNMNLSQHKLYVNISKIKTIYSFSLKKSKCNKNHRQCYVIFIIQRTEFLSRTDCQIKIKKFLSNYCWS